MKGTIKGKRLVGFEDEPFGTAVQEVETRQGAVVLVDRAEDLGGGSIVLPARELEDRDEEIVAPYGKLSIREAPPYSPNVPLEAYLRFWKRLGVSNYNETESEYLTADSGPVTPPVAGPRLHLTDSQITEMIKERILLASGVSPHLIEVSVRNGTVLLEGEQPDIQARLAAGQAADHLPGVKEIVNMLIVRAI